MKESFLLYKSTYSAIKELSMDEKGLLLDAIFQYQIEGKILDLPPVLSMAFRFMKDQFDRDAGKYVSIVERNRANGSKGGRPRKNQDNPKKPNGLFHIQDETQKPKKADTDTDTDTVSDRIINIPDSKFSGKGYKTKSDIVREKAVEAAEDLARRMYENQKFNSNK